jgi:hypothetical protein
MSVKMPSAATDADADARNEQTGQQQRVENPLSPLPDKHERAPDPRQSARGFRSESRDVATCGIAPAASIPRPSTPSAPPNRAGAGQVLILRMGHRAQAGQVPRRRTA